MGEGYRTHRQKVVFVAHSLSIFVAVCWVPPEQAGQYLLNISLAVAVLQIDTFPLSEYAS